MISNDSIIYGSGLMNQIEKEYKRVYTTYNGERTLQEFHIAIENQLYLPDCETLHEQGLITYEEKINLINMIKSDDRENFVIAKVIIENKKTWQ